ncbi:AI-2E family transporter [Aurantibacillus circumpalustris]|uniref:AI-2E family transporter n=1 Tax=Aurantibacillus circumpalustris TaxID=3036359 RepID=UPI00295A9FF1|nr:AI-2E family transporter [Aurantibacillus circumpalustris]
MKLNINVWRIIGVLALIFFVLIFFKIVIYLLISLVLFLLGSPVTYRLNRVKIGSKKIPNSISALFTLVLIISILFGFFYLIIPPLASEIDFLYGLNFYEVMHNTLNQFPSFKSLLLKFGSEEAIKQNVTEQLSGFMSANNIGFIVNNIFAYFSTITAGILCVLFITFFLLRDSNIVKESILVITPSGYENATSDILRTSKKMLSKYFTGLFLDMVIVGTTVLVSLSILGIKNALVIAFFASILNVIPYIGSMITVIIALTLGVSSCISTGSYELISPTIYKIFFTLLSINLLDGFILQPFIFSNSVKAHPLEIFLVTLMAASLGGVFAMVVALPTYTLIRIVAKEFLTHLKFFKKISEKINS